MYGKAERRHRGPESLEFCRGDSGVCLVGSAEVLEGNLVARDSVEV